LAPCVDRIAEAIDDAAKQALADGNIDNRASPLDDIALADFGVGTKSPRRHCRLRD